MEFIIKAVALWVIALMVFFVNPLNDPLNPNSEINKYHFMNLRIRQEVEKELEAEGKTVIVDWADVAPYVSATWVTALCLAIDYFIRKIL